MNILVIYDENDDEVKQFVCELENIVKNNEFSSYKIKIYYKQSNKTKYDICLLISNNTQFLINKVINTSQTFIVTSNITSSHILECVNISTNTYYLKKGAIYVLEKIVERYMYDEKKIN